MSDSDLHPRMLGFLAQEFAKKDNQVCVRLELEYRPTGGFKAEQIREWIRQDDPDLFEMAKLPDFISTIIDIAEAEADAKPPGKHSFALRTHQYFKGRQLLSFWLQPSVGGADRGTAEDTTALALAGSSRQDTAQVLQVVSNHASQLMRTNTSMFGDVVRTQNATNERLSKQNAELHAENILLRREVEEGRSSKFEREYAISKELRTEQRTAASWNKAMQIAGLVATKIAGHGNAPSIAGQPSGLQMLLGNFRDSIRPDQFQALLQVFDQVQLMMLNEIMSHAPQDQPPQQQQQQEAAPQNGAPSP